jgi:hypothetical protein
MDDVAIFDSALTPQQIEVISTLTDQRGAPFMRNVGGGVDIGAYESAGFDFGDAPSPYPTTLPDGAVHEARGPRLGASRDTEADGQPNANADGDGADEDGAMFGIIGTDAPVAAVNIDLQNAATATVDAWIDVNGNNVWEPAEQILTNVAVTSGLQTINYNVPTGAVVGDTIARVRISSGGELAPTGFAADGEVEDHVVTIVSETPQVESVIINGGIDPSRSKVTSLTVEFDTEVDHAALNSAFAITNITDDTQVGTVIVTPSDSGGKTTAVLTFAGASTLAPQPAQAGVLGTTLLDGNYRLDVLASGVQLATNSAATMPVDYVFGGQQKADPNNDDFFRLYGDLTGDGFTTNAEYFFSMLPAIGSQIGDSAYREDLDANGDGFVTNFEAFFNFLPSIGQSRD